MHRAILVSLVLVAPAAAAPQFATYSNARYGYSIEYPASMLKPVQSADGGTGQAFAAISGDAGFRVYAHALAGHSPESLADEAQQVCPGERPSYRVVKRQLAAVSCETGDRIIYQKSLLRNGLEITVRGEYPARERHVWDAVVTSIARSMSTRDSP